MIITNTFGVCLVVAIAEKEILGSISGKGKWLEDGNMFALYCMGLNTLLAHVGVYKAHLCLTLRG